MQTPVAKLADDLWALIQMQNNHSDLMPPTLQRQLEVDIRHTVGAAGLADKAVAWLLAPVFFCCVVVEKARPPKWHSWASTEVFSRVVVSFMLKLFVLATELAGGERQKQCLVD
ncbi:hypothetical protein PRNP1_008059 [Phytophthora ramorum]|uniref:uncharacterized protein n=1 Tax=Phytophthora ramorum TaxID=164328 RepID=UPI0030A6759C|nr:hypothetical protein KRP23_5314 [Phytophthora ramorum]